MITGFNTDIEYQGVTYHVQTEDKGTATPLILSLVYNGGTILASKRSPYNDLLLESFDEKVLAERLQRQHKLICAAISSGRIEDLKRMSMKSSASKVAEKLVEQSEPQSPITQEKVELKENVKSGEISTKQKKQKSKENDIPKFDVPEPQILKQTTDIDEEFPDEQTNFDLEQILNEERIEVERRTANPVPIPKPKTELWEPQEKKPSAEETIIEAVEIIEDVEILSADAVEIVGEKSSSQKFLEDLSRVQGGFDNKTGGALAVKILGDETFYSGEEKTLQIIVFRGTADNFLGGAHIMVKILGSTFSPLLYHAKTDSNGIAVVHLTLPVFGRGRSIVLVKAMSDGDEVEFRRIIKAR